MSYLWDEVEAIAKLGEDLYNDIVNAPLNYVREIMDGLNRRENGSYPIAQEFMSRSIHNRGDVVYDAQSPIANAIAESREFKEFVKDQGSSTVSALLSFRADPNLSRSLHDCTLTGALDVSGQDFTFKGQILDRYDFRYDWLPPTFEWRAIKLRIAGNIAKACTDVGIMQPYDVTVNLDFNGTI